jgi:D-galactarolactone cycloisomerase
MLPATRDIECCHPDRDPLFWELVANRRGPAEGDYRVPDGPGFGLELDPAAIERYRVT